MFTKPLSALALFLACVSAVKITVPDQGDRGTLIPVQVEYEDADRPEDFDFFLFAAGAEKPVYAIGYGFRDLKFPAKVALPFVDNPGQQYQFFAVSPYTLGSGSAQLLYGTSNNITIN